MTSHKYLGLGLATMFALSALPASTANAFCALVKVAGSGKWSNSACNAEAGAKEWVKIEMRSALDAECGKVEAPETTGKYTEDQCANTVGASKPWIMIKAANACEGLSPKPPQNNVSGELERFGRLAISDDFTKMIAFIS